MQPGDRGVLGRSSARRLSSQRRDSSSGRTSSAPRAIGSISSTIGASGNHHAALSPNGARIWTASAGGQPALGQLDQRVEVKARVAESRLASAARIRPRQLQAAPLDDRIGCLLL